MQLRVVRRIESAVQSITSCTSPQVQVGGVVAAADRLCSPYASRRTVEYSVAESLPYKALYAASPSHALLIGVADNVAGGPEGAFPAYPIGGLVHAWEGGLVPYSLVQPVFGLARELGLRPEGPHGELVKVFVLSPVLAGFHYTRPVFFAAAGDENRPLELCGEPVYRQGSLLVGWCGDDVPAAPTWACWAAQPFEWFFNHSTAYKMEREQVLSTTSAEAVASPVAVLYRGEPHAAVALRSPAIIVARDHDTVEIPEGNFLAIHPFPERGGGMD